MQVNKISGIEFRSFKGQHFDDDLDRYKYRTSEDLKLMHSLEVLSSINSIQLDNSTYIKDRITDISKKSHTIAGKMERGTIYATNVIDTIIRRSIGYGAAAWYFRAHPDETETKINGTRYTLSRNDEYLGSMFVKNEEENTSVLFSNSGDVLGIQYLDCTIFTNGFFNKRGDLKPAMILRNYTVKDGEKYASEVFDYINNQVYTELVIDATGKKTFDEFYEFHDKGGKKLLKTFDNNELKFEFLDKVSRYAYSSGGKEYMVTTEMNGI